jgi:hypothetical protein
MAAFVSKPIKVDLDLSQHQRGGNVFRIIKDMNINKNKYLYDKTNAYKFEFEDNKQSYFGSNYFAKGNITALYKLKEERPIVRSNLILRVINPSQLSNIDIFIGKYNEDYALFGENMISIFYYGSITLLDGFRLPYLITQIYADHNNIKRLPEDRKIELMADLLRFNVKLDESGYAYRDLKFENIGYDRDFKFIALDYDMITLVKKSNYKPGNIWSNDSLQRDELLMSHLSYGTYPPIYLIEGDYTSLDFINTIPGKINKIASIAIVEILNNMFINDTCFNNICIDYLGSIVLRYGFKSYDRKTISDYIIKLNGSRDICRRKLLSKYPEKYIIINLMYRLTSNIYLDIPTPQKIYHLFNEYVKIVNPKLAHVPRSSAAVTMSRASVPMSRASVPTPSLLVPTPSASVPTPSASVPTPSLLVPTPSASVPTPSASVPKSDFSKSDAKKYLKYKLKYLELKKILQNY